jgi:NAD(P)-dependent dehydrogenase (short-subunit alcohol dehydrogenase family)
MGAKGHTSGGRRPPDHISELTMTIQSKIALVTGASRGLGRATALGLARAGVDVIITYRSNEAEAEQALTEIGELGRRGLAFRHDASDVSTFDAFAGEVRGALKNTWGRDTFDFLVNNAGSAVSSPFAQTTVEAFDSMLNVQFKGVYFLTQRLLPLLADGGGIVNISSGLTRFTDSHHSAYASMKGAIEVLTRYLAADLGPRGINVNTLAPGPTQTDFAGGVFQQPGVAEAIASQNVFGRMGQPDDIGEAIAALLSEGNRWVTAQRIEASGGAKI